MKMYKYTAKFAAIVLAATAFFFTAQSVFAVSPVLTLTSNGDGDTVQVSVTGDPSVSVLMSYQNTSLGQQWLSLGSTASNGTLMATVSTSAKSIAVGSYVYVTTNGINGPQSAQVAWPSVTGNGSGLTLSQTSIVLASGQSQVITATSNSSGALYLSNNSNPSIANFSISGTQITVNAISNGQTTGTICNQASPAACASVFVNVGTNAQPLTFSMANVTVSPGQSVPITISGGNGSYIVLNNSNSSIIQTNISGSTITLSTTVTSGSSAITVCSSNLGACGIINASAGTASTTALTFSQYNPSITQGQSLNVTVSGGSSGASYYVSTNSNGAVVSSSISGNNLTLNGISSGSSTITVCASSGGCGSITATVNYSSGGGAVALSQTSMSLLLGQVLSLTVSGGTAPYSLTPQGSSGIYQASITGNVITVSAISSGSGNLYVCSSGGACAILYVVVNASGSGGAVTFSQNNLAINIGASSAVTISGAGGYYVSNSTSPNVASAQISGSTVVVNGLVAGTDNISICQTGGQCSLLFVTVGTNISNGNGPVVSQTNPTVGIGQNYITTVSGGATGSYYVSSNSSPSVAQLSLSNGQLTITGLANGVSTAVICSTSTSCTTMTITVGSGGSSLTLSQPSLTLTIGQTSVATISGSGGSYYVSSNSGPSIASVTISGSQLSVTGLANGTASVVICGTSTSCATLTVTVGSGSSSGALTLNPATVTLVTGNTSSVTISGGGGYNVFSSTNSSVATVTINGNTATVTALTAGNDSVFICQTGGQCSVLSIVVAGVGPPNSGPTDSVGTNVLSPDGTVYMITSAATKRPYTSAGAFLSYGFNSWTGVVVASAADLALPTGNFIPPRDGKIICSNKGPDQGTCYLITKSQKAGFTSSAVFTGLGFSFSNALSGDVSFLASAPNISNTTSAHLPGTLINKLGTVYLVGTNGLLGVPNMTTLTSWGYSLTDVVPANASDAALSLNGIMAAKVAGALSPTVY